MHDRDNAYQGSVCTDCLIAIANGDLPHEWTEKEIADWRDRVEKQNEGVEDVTLGHFHDSDRCYHQGKECEDDCDCERTEFSNSPCDNCGSFLAGSRDDAVFWLKSTN